MNTRRGKKPTTPKESAAKSPSPSQQAVPRDASPTDEPSPRAAATQPAFQSAAEAVLGVSSIVSGESPTYSTPLGKMPDTPGRKPLAENLTTMEGLDEASNPLPQKDPLSYARVLKNPSPPGSPSTRPHSPIPSKLDSTLGRVESLLESLSKKLDSMDTRVKQ